MSNCKLCNNLTKTAGLARLAIDFEPWELLQSEKLSGCRACATILAGIRRLQNPSWRFEDDVRRVYLYGLSNNHETLYAEIYYKNDRPRLVLEFYHLSDGMYHHYSYDSLTDTSSRPHEIMCLRTTDSDSQSPWEAIRSRKQTNGHPLGRHTLSWVKTNLDNCEHGHELCSPNIKAPLPFRTLHLKQSAEDMVEVTLVESELGVATGRYATLSHRWGNQQTCITTQSNICDRKYGIPWDTIPKTFQDAMIYCLKLGVGYLWIDALCIIQDSPTDWQQQSAQMAAIYRNSYITLSATTTINDSVGCFGVSSSTLGQWNERLFSQNPPIYVREKLYHWTDTARGSLKEKFPLLTRGWVFQERILSMRTLHFCDQELVWECAETTACECASISVEASIKRQFSTSVESTKVEISIKQATGLIHMLGWIRQACVSFMGNVSKELSKAEEEESQARHVDIRGKREYSQRQLERAKVEPKKRPSLRISGDGTYLRQETNGRDPQIWHKMVEQYSVLELTRMSDRLPALSGLAARVAPESRPYLAGLWNDTIRLDLLWRVDQISEAHRRTPENLSPTWSWSSVSSGVKYWTREELKENIIYTRLAVGSTSTNIYRHPNGPLQPRRQPLVQHMLQLRGEGNGNASQELLTDPARLDQLSPELLDWCLLERSCTLIPSISHEIVQIGQNPFGEVKKGVLKIRGYVRKATLKYVRVLSDKRYQDWENDPFQYQLDLSITAAGWKRAFQDVQVHFHADYNLSESHDEHKVRHDEDVYLLELLVNLFLVLRCTRTGNYQRIGIFRARLNWNQSRGMDLMMDGDIQNIWLV